MIMNKFSREKIYKYKLIKSPIIVLNFLINRFIYSKKKYINNIPYIYVSNKYIADFLGLTDRQVKETLNRLSKEKIILKKINKKAGNKLYVSLNLLFIQDLLADIDKNKLLIKKLKQLLRGEDMLLELETKKHYSDFSKNLVNKIILENNDLFSMRIVPDNPTKTYNNTCKILQDIYNGNYTNSRIYTFEADDFPQNWKERIKDVKGDWNKVESLLKSAINNYRLMQDKNRKPLNKKTLTRSLEKFLYDDYNTGSNRSFFIQCLKEPDYIYKYFSEVKADEIFDNLSNIEKKIGNKLFSLNKSMPAGRFWELLKKMFDWCKFVSAYDTDQSIYQIVDNSVMLIDKYYDYIVDNDIAVSLPTLDIEKSIKHNMPWKWFLTGISKDYNIDIEYLECVTQEDFMNYIDRMQKELPF